MALRIANFIALLSIVLLFSNCKTVKVIQQGTLNMVSARNVDSKMDYVLVKSYMGISEKDLKKESKKKFKEKSNTMEEALNQTVKNTPGGEFLKNVKLYQVVVTKGKKTRQSWAFEGDVWGTQQQSYRGFSIGDLVQWKDFKKVTHKGKITGLKDSSECMVKENGDENSKSVSYDKLSKVSE